VVSDLVCKFQMICLRVTIEWIPKCRTYGYGYLLMPSSRGIKNL